MSNFPSQRRVNARAWTTGLAAALALATAGCDIGSDPHHKTPDSSSYSATCQPAGCGPERAPAPVPITPQGARAVLASYIKINNSANRTRSLALNERIETGAIRDQSRAGYKAYPVWTKYQKDSLAPFTYTQPHFYIPRATPEGQAPWFAALARGSSAKGPWTSYMVFTRVAPGTWKMAAETAVDKGVTVPAVMLDAQGYATALPADSTGMAIPPSLLPLAVNDNYSTGGRNTGAVFTATPGTTAQRALHKSLSTRLAPYGGSDYTPMNDPYREVFALRTVGGGALVIASSVHGIQDYAGAPGAYLTLRPGSDQLAWLHRTRFYDITTTYTCLDAAAIPRTGKVAQLGSDCEITDATGG